MRKNTDIELGRALLLLLFFGLIWLVCKGQGTLWSIHKDNWLWHPYVMAHEREKPRRVERIHELHTKQGQMCGLFFFKNNCQSLPWLHKVFFLYMLSVPGLKFRKILSRLSSWIWDYFLVSYSQICYSKYYAEITTFFSCLLSMMWKPMSKYQLRRNYHKMASFSCGWRADHHLHAAVIYFFI